MGSTSSTARHEPQRSQRAPTEVKRIPSDKQLTAILQTFNTWAFKREQPSDLALLKRCVARAVTEEEKISFVLYWGKGPRSEIAAPDLLCLDYLAALGARIKGSYSQGAEISLVLTDTHASLNGHSKENISTYFSDVDCEALKRGFRTFLLSEVTGAVGNYVSEQSCSPPSEAVLQRLVGSAERWYRGDGHPIDGARKYYQMNMIERRAIEHFFPTSIFVTFNGSDQRDLFPEALPIFYMYSLRRGTSIKPWFLSGLPEVAAAAADHRA